MNHDKKINWKKIWSGCKNAIHRTGDALAVILRPIVDLLTPIFTPIFRISYYVGASTVLVANRLIRRFMHVWNIIQKRLAKGARRAKRRVLNATADLRSDFSGAKKKWHEGRINVKTELEEARKDGKRVFVTKRIKAYGKEIHSNRASARKFFNYFVPAVCLCIFAGVLIWSSTLTIALQVTVRGHEVGYIENEGVFEQADKNLQKRIVYNSGDQLIYNTPVYSIAVVSADEISDANQVCDNIIQASGADFTQATGVYVGGQLVGATTEGTQLKEFLKARLAEYDTGAPNEEVSFQRGVETVDGLFMSKTIRDYDDLYGQLTGNVVEQITHTVEAGDTPISIAAHYGMSVGELYSMNPSFNPDTDTLHVGNELIVQRSQQYLAVQVQRTIEYTESIAYAKEEVKDGNYFVGTKKVTTTGQDGQAAVTAKVTYIDGVESSRVIVARTVTAEPVNEVTHVGTKVRISSGATVDMSNVNATGSYVWPVQGGSYNYVSMEMYGYYGHTGMDIAAPAGTAIVAVDSGVVTVASRLYLNGLYITINHGNGLETLYCHCSALYVTAGQTVSKGQLIGAVGRTGNATGNHLHIEFKRYGVFQNPRSYLGW